MRNNPRKPSKIRVESLEKRELMAADIQFNNGEVLIFDEGTASDETAIVTLVGAKVNIRVESRINGQLKDVDTKSFHIKDVTSINFNGADGSDRLDVRQEALSSNVNLRNVKVNFNGGNGVDTFNNYSSVQSFAHGGMGTDTLNGGSDMDILYGGPDKDTITGGLGSDTISGGGDADQIWGDYTYLTSLGAVDTIFGDEGDDVIRGGAGGDMIYGGIGVDRIWGDYENITSVGYNDTILGQEGDDIIHGGGGNDIIWGDQEDRNYVGNDTLYGDDGQDSIYGGFGNDTIAGGNHNDRLYGGPGRDTVNGNDGDDYLTGGIPSLIPSNDSDGEADVLIGGAGADIFEIDHATRRTWKFWKWFTESYNRDAGADFNSSQGDREVNWS